MINKLNIHKVGNKLREDFPTLHILIQAGLQTENHTSSTAFHFWAIILIIIPLALSYLHSSLCAVWSSISNFPPKWGKAERTGLCLPWYISMTSVQGRTYSVNWTEITLLHNSTPPQLDQLNTEKSGKLSDVMNHWTTFVSVNPLGRWKGDAFFFPPLSINSRHFCNILV